MALENFEVAKNAGDLLKNVGEALRPNSDGGSKINMSEWIKIGIEFAQSMGADWQDDDDE